tara:strand:- start:931 stop:1377 length:447 start_codon:yes stop_codon:yes gene_type:complete
MKINVQTFIQTDSDLVDVFNLFNKDMFYELTKNAPVKPIRYDGDFVGAEIHLKMLFPWKDDWVSIITDKSEGDNVCFFVDQGKKLPFNILQWRHTHILRKTEKGVIIEDDIYFKSTNIILDRFWWISFMPQFLLRKLQYKKYIKKHLL